MGVSKALCLNSGFQNSYRVVFFVSIVTIREVGFNDTRCDSGEDLCYYDPLLLTCNFTGSHDSGIQIIIPNYDGLVLYSNNTLIETESSLPPLISVQSYRAFSYSSSTDYIIELFIEQAIVLVYEEIFCTELET